jgi:hypothetical protein
MAHPGLWGFGLASVALVAAGVWLKQADPGLQTPGARPAGPVPIATEPVPAPVSGPGSGPASGPVSAPPVSAPLSDPAGRAPGPDVPTGPVTGPPADPPAGTTVPPEPAGAASGAEPAPDPAPAKGTPPSPPSGQAPPAQGPDQFGSDDDGATLPGPRVYAGPDHWLPGPLDAISPEAILEATRAADLLPGGAVHFGAIAAPATRPRTRFVVQGYNELAQAEAHALDLCARFEAGCVILAWLVPMDWDGPYEGTLGARQRPAWEAFAALPPGTSRAFAISAEGATGYGTALTETIAREIAIRDCQETLDRIRLPATTPGPCRIVALRGP